MTVHWILFGSRLTGSSRIHGYQIHEELTRQGYDSRLLVAPPEGIQMYDLPWNDPENLVVCPLFQPGDVVVFETVRGPQAQRLAASMQQKGLQVCFLECDLYPESSLANYATTILCTSNYLADEMRKRHHEQQVLMIPDPVETQLSPHELPLRVQNRAEGLRLVWIGHAGHWDTLREIRQILAEAEFQDLRLLTVSNHPDADVLWSPEIALSALRSADVQIVPVGHSPEAAAKSNNRVVQGMALGCAVLAGDLPAYREVINTGLNGYLCRTPEDWRQGLREVRNVSKRRTLVYHAHQRVEQQFALEAIAQEYAKKLKLTKGIRHDRACLPSEFQMEQAAVYSGWYLAQRRFTEAFRWSIYALAQKWSLKVFPITSRVIAEKLRNRLQITKT